MKMMMMMDWQLKVCLNLMEKFVQLYKLQCTDNPFLRLNLFDRRRIKKALKALSLEFVFFVGCCVYFSSIKKIQNMPKVSFI
jgi:hypothetical protein